MAAICQNRVDRVVVWQWPSSVRRPSVISSNLADKANLENEKPRLDQVPVSEAQFTFCTFGDDRQFIPLLEFNQVAEGLTRGGVMWIDIDDVVFHFRLGIRWGEKQRNM